MPKLFSFEEQSVVESILLDTYEHIFMILKNPSAVVSMNLNKSKSMWRLCHIKSQARFRNV